MKGTKMTSLKAAVEATEEILDLVKRAVDELNYGVDTNAYGVLGSPTSARRSLIRAQEKLEKALGLVESATCDKEYQSS
jgi:hypothetical protein